MLRILLIALGCQLALEAATPLNCPAGVPLGDVRLSVEGDPGEPLLPLRSINRLGEGDTVYYTPVKLRLKPKGGKVALVVAPVSKELPVVRVLDAIDADKPGQWKMPFRVSVAALVYGPEGLNPKRVKAFLSSDEDLIVQLADYAEKTSQAEALISAVSSGTPLNPTQVDAALNGMGAQAGVGAVDRTLPKDQQLAVMLGRVNPTLAGVDPVAPDLSVRTQAAASVVTAVAGMFLGSPGRTTGSGRNAAGDEPSRDDVPGYGVPFELRATGDWFGPQPLRQARAAPATDQDRLPMGGSDSRCETACFGSRFDGSSAAGANWRGQRDGRCEVDRPGT